jgi:hypothetical protein
MTELTPAITFILLNCDSLGDSVVKGHTKNQLF